jgi:peptidoglycan/LPS O-acetylase OafA/YrhL
MLRDHQTSIIFWTQSTQAAWNALAGFSSATLALIASSNFLIFGTDYLITRMIMPDGGIVTTAEVGAIPAHGFMLFPPAWTLAIEMLFYLLAPIIMFRRAILIVASCVAMALIIGLNVRQPGSLLNLSYCVAGMSTYYIYRALPDTLAVRRAGAMMMAATMLFAVCANYIPVDNNIKINIFIGMTWLSLPFAFVTSRNLKFDRWLGNASYGMYVSHFAVYKLLTIVVSTQVRTTVYFPALLAAGLLLASFVEQPIDKNARASVRIAA